jgi:hypothetical protein
MWERVGTIGEAYDCGGFVLQQGSQVYVWRAPTLKLSAGEAETSTPSDAPQPGPDRVELEQELAYLHRGCDEAIKVGRLTDACPACAEAALGKRPDLLPAECEAAYPSADEFGPFCDQPPGHAGYHMAHTTLGVRSWPQ